jgi:hypothetical protein
MAALNISKMHDSAAVMSTFARKSYVLITQQHFLLCQAVFMLFEDGCV